MHIHSKVHLETKKAIMSKAHKEGGDLISSAYLASAFLILRIADIWKDEAETEQIDKPRSDNESKPLTYKAALQSPQARE